MNKERKILFLANIPSPYRVDFFNEFGKLCNLTVTFEGEKATDRNEKWGGKEAEHFKAIYLNGIRYNAEQFLCLDIVKILKKNWDVIIVGVYSSLTSILAIEYMKRHHMKFIISADGGFIVSESKMKYKLKRHLISSASYWLSTGRTTTEYLVHYGAQKDKCYIFPFTSLLREDVERAKVIAYKDKKIYKDKLKIKENKVILSVGQFIYRKGFDLLIKSVNGIPSDTGIYIIGGKLTNEYSLLKEEYHADNIHFIDFLNKEELIDYYAAADIFVFPTREDIWGLVINEALAYGLPVLTTDKCIAGLELIHEEINGWIIPADNLEKLIEKLQSILKIDDLGEYRNSCIEISKAYTIENMAFIHYEILDRILNKNEEN